LRAHFLVKLGGKYSELQIQQPAFATIVADYGSGALSCLKAGERIHGVRERAGEELLSAAHIAPAKRRFAAYGGSGEVRRRLTEGSAIGFPTRRS
jgi:hypothetical protein